LKINYRHSDCEALVIPVKDALNMLSGKWKLLILVSLSFGTKRFKQISIDLGNISSKVLTKELNDLVENKLVVRMVYDDFPPLVEYSMTEFGKTFEPVINELSNWGITYKKRIIRK
jgi:DNA-binding HxlR family transcriptional regulator